MLTEREMDKIIHRISSIRLQLEMFQHLGNAISYVSIKETAMFACMADKFFSTQHEQLTKSLEELDTIILYLSDMNDEVSLKEYREQELL
ncbi:hypothetical protein GMA11_04345 [Granulicatella sp. zg-ZJ]|uniref:hypothetical protein n=1 Tax=Granulicatella sp. zg-ZJ TaxID=2678504 RepID=UPI0013D4E85A|nr:hypothetical protein [Granulicatella sp. zg-ZJ]NEW62619.1 hypothetical protein [Granulicatella sp. zg-ZJ]